MYERAKVASSRQVGTAILIGAARWHRDFHREPRREALGDKPGPMSRFGAQFRSRFSRYRQRDAISLNGAAALNCVCDPRDRRNVRNGDTENAALVCRAPAIVI
jgi:hypothetical protein